MDQMQSQVNSITTVKGGGDTSIYAIVFANKRIINKC